MADPLLIRDFTGQEWRKFNILINENILCGNCYANVKKH